MSELQLIIGLLSTKPQICLHFDNFLFKHTSKPHICLHFDHFLSKPTQNLSSFPPVSIEGMWSSNEYGRSMSLDINMCPPHCPWCHTQGPKVYLVLLDAQTAKEAMCRKKVLDSSWRFHSQSIDLAPGDDMNINIYHVSHYLWCHTWGLKVYLMLRYAQTAKEAMYHESFRSLRLLMLSQSVTQYGNKGCPKIPILHFYRTRVRSLGMLVTHSLTH